MLRIQSGEGIRLRNRQRLGGPYQQQGLDLTCTDSIVEKRFDWISQKNSLFHLFLFQTTKFFKAISPQRTDLSCHLSAYQAPLETLCRNLQKVEQPEPIQCTKRTRFSALTLDQILLIRRREFSPTTSSSLTFCKNSPFWFCSWFGFLVGCGLCTSKSRRNNCFLIY